MFYSEGGQSNGHISQRLIDTGLNHSASIPMWSGDPPVQLQGLTVCGSVTAGRHNWIFLKFYLHFWPALEPCKRATIKDIDFIFPVRTRPTLTCPPCKYEGMDNSQLIHSSLSNLGTISLKSGTLRVKMSYSEAGPWNGQISLRLMDTALYPSGSIPIW